MLYACKGAHTIEIPLHQSQHRDRSILQPIWVRERERERGRRREKEREREKERVIFKGMTGALAPFSYLVTL
jgi:hypothetical protein